MFTRMTRFLAPEDVAGNGTPDKGGDPNPDKGTDGAYTQAQVDDIMNKVRATEQGKTQDAVDDALRKANLSTSDKAIDAAVSKVKSDHAAELAVRDRKDSIRDGLLEAGVPAQKIRAALAMVHEFAGDTEDVAAAIATTKTNAPEGFFPEEDPTKLGPGDGGNPPDPKGGPKKWDAATVEKELSGMTPEDQARFWIEKGDEVKAYQARTSTHRVIPPGKRMHEV